MTDDQGPAKTLIVVAIVGVGLLCGLGGMLGAVLFFYSSSQRAELEQAREAALAEQEEQHRAWLESLPADERETIALFEDSERVAVELVREIVAGRVDGPTPAVALALRGLAGGTPPVAVHSPRAETTESDDGRVRSVSVDVVLEWDASPPTTVRVTLDRAADGTLTASGIDIADAVETE